MTPESLDTIKTLCIQPDDSAHEVAGSSSVEIDYSKPPTSVDYVSRAIKDCGVTGTVSAGGRIGTVGAGGEIGAVSACGGTSALSGGTSALSAYAVPPAVTVADGVTRTFTTSWQKYESIRTLDQELNKTLISK